VNDTALTIEVVRGWARRRHRISAWTTTSTSWGRPWSRLELARVAGHGQDEGFQLPSDLQQTVMITETADNIDVYAGIAGFRASEEGFELKRTWRVNSYSVSPRKIRRALRSDGRRAACGISEGDGAGARHEQRGPDGERLGGFLKDAFQYGSSTKLFFAGPLILSQISGLPRRSRGSTPGDDQIRRQGHVVSLGGR